MKKPRNGSKVSMIEFLLPILFFIITISVYIPCTMFLGNIDEFSIDYLHLLTIVLIPAVAIFALWLIIAFAIRRKKVLAHIFIDLLFGISLGVYVQNSFLNGTLNQLNGGDGLSASISTSQSITSVIVWVLCLILPHIIRRISSKIEEKVTQFGSASLITMQLVSLIVISLTTTRTVSNDYVLSKRNEFQLSSKNNVVVFVVDTLDAQWAEKYIISEQKYTDELKGFTYFNNVVSGGAPTILGMRTMLSGTYFDPNTPIGDYFATAYEHSTLFKDLQENNYAVKLYTLQTYLNNADFENIDNALLDCRYVVDSRIRFTEDIYKLVAYYGLPYPLKPFFEIYSGALTNNATLAFSEDENMIIDDAAFYQDYLSNGISLTDNRNVFVLYHLFGAHGPFTLSADAQRVDDGKSSLREQIDGVMKIIFAFIDDMKRLGIYDNSTIIITADHGGVAIYQNPAVFIKRGNTQKELEIDSAPLTFLNLRSSFVDGIVEDYMSSYGPNMFDIDENAEIDYRIHTFDTALYRNVWDDGETVAKDFYQYRIGNPARDNTKIVKSN